jgi:hypothetical protein
MIRTVVMGSALAAVLLLSGQQPAKAEWLCSPNKCVWVNYDVDEPDFAVNWAPPLFPNCFWRQGILGRWKYVCPGR